MAYFEIHTVTTGEIIQYFLRCPLPENYSNLIEKIDDEFKQNIEEISLSIWQAMKWHSDKVEGFSDNRSQSSELIFEVMGLGKPSESDSQGLFFFWDERGLSAIRVSTPSSLGVYIRKSEIGFEFKNVHNSQYACTLTSMICFYLDALEAYKKD